MLQWLRLRTPHAGQAARLNGTVAPTAAANLIGYLVRQIAVPRRAASILTRANRFKTLPEAQQEKELPAVYLLLERYLIEVDLCPFFTREELRTIVRAQYGSLLSKPSFNVIFQPTDQQELFLCKALAMTILQRAFSILGATGKNYLVTAIDRVSQVPDDAPGPVPACDGKTRLKQPREWIEVLGVLLRDLQERINALLGEHAARRIVEECYQELADAYMLLETFPVVLNVLPDALVSEPMVSHLSPRQMQRALLDKVEDLQRANEQLLATNRELESAKRILTEMNATLRSEIAERQRTEAALRASEARKSAMLESALDCVITIDHEGRVVEFNPAAEQVFGYRRDDVMGKLMAELIIPPSLREPHWQGFKRYLETGLGRVMGKRVELTAMRADGVEFPVELTVTRIHLDGQPVFMAFLRDISERQAAEEALRASEQRLREALEQREQISQDLHDGIIQSVYAIGLTLKVCQRLIAQDPTEATTKLGEAIGDLNRVIHDVRGFITDLGPGQVSRQGLRAALSSLVRTMEGPHTFQFRLHVEAAAVELVTAEQATHLLYIAQEAMSNSLRHSGGATGVVSLQIVKDCVRLEVSDDGTGFNSAVLDDRGQGLQNIASRAKKLSARYEVVSELGRGTSVIVDVPMERVHVRA